MTVEIGLSLAVGERLR